MLVFIFDLRCRLRLHTLNTNRKITLLVSHLRLKDISIPLFRGTLCSTYYTYYTVVSIFWVWLMLMNAQADSPPCTMIIGREGRSYVHSLRHLSIIWRNLPQLRSLFFYCTETLPVLDFLLSAEGRWWNENGLASQRRDFCFPNCVKLLFNSGVSVKEVTSEVESHRQRSFDKSCLAV